MSLLALMLALVPLQSHAQKVTVSLSTGNLITCNTAGQQGDQKEIGFQYGYASMWRHNQLPLALICSDYPDLTQNMILKRHSNNMHADRYDSKQIAVVATGTAHFTLSLPRGYRFKGYRLVLTDKYAAGTTVTGSTNDMEVVRSYAMKFRETDYGFSKQLSASSFSKAAGSTADADGKEYVIERSADDMGNVLYFRFDGGSTSDGPAALTIKSLIVEFSCNKDFTESVVPDEVSNDPVSVAYSSFRTGRQDVGAISYNSLNNAHFYSYTDTAVTDLPARMMIYSDQSVGSDGKFKAESASNKLIYEVQDANGDLYYGLTPGHTYYVESPTQADRMGANTNQIPLGYRITGADITVAKKEAYVRPALYVGTTISGTTYYLNDDGSYVTDKKRATPWTYAGKRLFSANGKYLYLHRSLTESDKFKLGSLDDVETDIEVDAYGIYAWGYNSYNKYYLVFSNNSWTTSEANDNSRNNGQFFNTNVATFYIKSNASGTVSYLGVDGKFHSDKSKASMWTFDGTYVYSGINYLYMSTSGMFSTADKFVIGTTPNKLSMRIAEDGKVYSTGNTFWIDVNYYFILNDNGSLGTSTKNKTDNACTADYFGKMVNSRLAVNKGGKTYYVNVDGTVTTKAQKATSWTYDGRQMYAKDAQGNSKYLYLKINDNWFTDNEWKIGTAADVQENESGTGHPDYQVYLDENYQIWSYGKYKNNKYKLTLNDNASGLAIQKNESSTQSGYISYIMSNVGDQFTVKGYAPKTSWQNDDEVATVSASEIASNGTKTISVTDLNNDAFKFRVESNGTGMVLVKFDLKMQALNPYVNSFSVMGSLGEGINGKLNEQMTATDFTAGGEDTDFYVPKSFENGSQTVGITFTDLYSADGGKGYYGTTSDKNKSRYSFYGSDYDKQISGKVYDNAETVATADYTQKISTSTVATEQWEFNNAADLFSTQNTSISNYLQEYLFDGNTYSSKMKVITLRSGDVNKLQTYYTVTKDEPQYNIAPTTSLVHEAFAFYKTQFKLRTAEFKPSLEYTPIYTNPYLGANAADNGQTFYGVKVTALDASNKPVKGFLEADSIRKALEEQKETYPLDRLLYIDASGLETVWYDADDATTESNGKLSALKDGLASNAFVYLPAAVKYAGSGVAYQTGEVFRSDADFTLADKQPLYLPYSVQLGTNATATYSRTLSLTNYSSEKRQYASVFLPFAFSTPEDNSYTIAKMDPSAEFTTANKDKDNRVNDGMIKYTTVSETEASKPYLLKMATELAANGGKFTVDRKAALLTATPSKDAVLKTGDTETHTFGNDNYTLTGAGSFCGEEMAAGSSKIFYFARNTFYTSETLTKSLRILPFRGFYCYSSVAMGAKLGSFGISMSDDDDPAITAVDAPDSYKTVVTTGTHWLAIRSAEDAAMAIYTPQGVRAAQKTFRAGECYSFSLPAGIYIVDGKKYMVK